MARFIPTRAAALGIAAVVVAGAAGGAVVALTANGHDSPSSTAQVVRTGLTMEIGGSLGYGGSYTVAVPPGASALQVAQAQQAVAEDQQTLAGDQQALSDASAARAAAQSPAAPAAHPSAAELAADSRFHQAQAAVLSDQVRLTGDQATLASLRAAELNPGTVYTWLPAAGQVISQNQRVYSVSGQPVPLLYGATPAYRAFYAGMTAGPDVLQLNRDLTALRYAKGLAKSDQYTPETTFAVEHWQKAHGLPETGRIPLGGVVFEPGAVRVTSVIPSPGQSASANGTVFAATGTTPVATVSLAPGQQNLFSPGDAVSVRLPAGTVVGGNVAKVTGSMATITLDSPPSQAVSGQEAVTVIVSSQTADHVLAVPVNALLTLPGGGYGVDVVTSGGSLRLVEVAVGLRSRTLVQVSGPGIAKGTTVAVPSALGQ